MRRLILLFCCCIFITPVFSQNVIRVASVNGDATKEIQAAIEQARTKKGKPVVIELQNRNYHLHRASSSAQVYSVSNTTSEHENPDPTKHIGLWLKGLKNVTIDGKGAKLITHGEMTTFVVDGCENIKFKNFSIHSDDPTVPELTVVEVGSNFLTVQIHPQSRYKITDGKFSFVGDSWTLSGGIAQGYDADKDITWRCNSPLNGMKKAIELEHNLIRFVYDKRPDAQVGIVFQMRDGIRDEVCGLIQLSRNTLIENVHFEFMGNFSVVGQMSENITYRNLTLEPEFGSGRTCVGFADFLHFSACRGKILIEHSRLVGAQDDLINVHGTYLKVVSFPSENQVLVRYMHHQTYGFQSFYAGNQVEFTNTNSLMFETSAKVKSAVMQNPREILITLEKPLSKAVLSKKELVVENVTYIPDVEIRGNYFSRIPTRGVLITSRGKVIIENNVFFRMQMSGVLIACDANSWFESGVVRDVTIRNNHFIECGTPVIYVAPENSINEGCVHQNIHIVGNRFELSGGDAIDAKSVDGLNVINNLFVTPTSLNIKELIKTSTCLNVVIRGNAVENGSKE